VNTQILSTKVYIPPPLSNLVPRPVLEDKFSDGLNEKLTLISAPAGYGKTTLLSEWCNRSLLPSCWFTLDESDNDIGRFLAYVFESLLSIEIDVDEQLLTLIQTPQQTQVENILIPLINQITHSQKNFVFVLEDYHHIQNDEIHEVVSYLLNHSPSTMHLVITTRSDPPLPLARLRARGQLVEIRASDLRFSVEEGIVLLNEIQNLQLPVESIETLIKRSDGWIAALQMIAITLKSRSNPTQYIQNLSGSQTYIADYLTEEVINQQSDQISDFLIKTSILDRLSGSLCDAVLGRSNSQKILKDLLDANMFIVALDDESKWFRYHRLFASLLNQRMLENQPEIIPSLYANASQWFGDHGFQDEAIEYAFRGEHIDRAATLIEQNAIITILRSEIHTFLRWVKKLPLKFVVQRPLLGILYAWAILISRGEKDSASAVLDNVEPENESQEIQQNTVRAILAVYDGELSTAIDLSRQALRQLSPEDHFFRNIAAWNLSGALAISGDPKGGLEVLGEVAESSLASQNFLIAIIALCRIGAATAQYGNLHSAKDVFERAIGIATGDQKRNMPAASDALMGLGKIYWEWNHFELAQKYLLESIDLSKRWREFTSIDSYVTLAQIFQQQGDAGKALQYMEDALWLANKNTATESDVKYVTSQKIHLHLKSGDLSIAQRWVSENELDNYIGAKTLEPSARLGENVILLYELVVLGRVLIAEARYNEALNIFELVLPSLDGLGFLSKIIEVYLLKARAHFALGDNSRAMTSLESALDLAEPDGFCRLFLEDGNEMAGLYREIESRSAASNFVRDILNTLLQQTGIPESQTEYFDTLSERENEVLQCLVSELSVPEIADQLYITTSTLRTHIKNIYSKLYVHSRHEAITKAKEIGLI